ncbi:hypothetical protein FE257_001580 [Aspergillus nanangensis]|uniref:Protein kinase domain-containing protein n=1 Tax=Aspergillus nanangensis TaxID=2582783 RepID=A0AAD4CTK6_ASPNN|nr:hypothetical protein FE257_001580 [Aspergillus nanangensis]
MSMFRSAAELSSSSSDSSSNEGDHEIVPTSNAPIGGETSPITRGAMSPPLLQGEEFGNYPGDSNSQSPLEAEPQKHANLMTAALLEFFCLSRAADLLNAQPCSQMRFTRDSPEVRYLGQKMYAYKSQFLASHGVLSEGIDTDSWGTTRQYYRDNLDVLGVSALEDLDLAENLGQVPGRSTTGDVVLASKTVKSVQLSTKEPAGPSERSLRRPRLSDIGKRLTSAERIGPLEHIRLDPRSLPTQSLPLSNNSPVSFPLFDNPPPTLRMSRYAMEFSEVKVLGRGSFGEVYHVKNHIDGQSYAVKKIPLSQKRLEQLQCGGENQLEGIMKEIRTLARLEHTNVVRYYGAWVEQAHVSGVMPMPPRPETTIKREFEQPDSNMLSHESAEDESFGIVFENSESADVVQVASSIEDESIVSSRPRRRSSHATATSRSSKKSSARSLDDDEDDIESIPRQFSAPSHGQFSSFGATDDIFTDGLSHDPAKLQVQRQRDGSQIPAVVLHIQMSLHPISLGSYLNTQSYAAPSENHAIPRRHCFHLIASLKLILSIISGVEYLHSKGIVHRDLKPANIFLSSSEKKDLDGCPSCQVKTPLTSSYCHPRIGDFGLVADMSHLNEPAESPKINRIVGTEFYRPPLSRNVSGALDDLPESEEENDFYRIDETLDIYALGVILFELLYRLNTRMERQMVLSELTRGPHGQAHTRPCARRPSFPDDFAQKVDMGQMTISDDLSIAQAMMECINGMLEPTSSRRWCCSDVKRHLNGILARLQKLSC